MLQRLNNWVGKVLAGEKPTPKKIPRVELLFPTKEEAYFKAQEFWIAYSPEAFQIFSGAFPMCVPGEERYEFTFGSDRSIIFPSPPQGYGLTFYANVGDSLTPKAIETLERLGHLSESNEF
jgi:hypothetical protein